ncbi:MAG: MaoC family dehydratase [Rhizobium sp.]|nr:MaoC family dehydratase [Rhizobium sp.]
MSDIRYWLEDFTPGRIFQPAPRKITSAEIMEFAQEFDPQPFHLSEEAGRASILGGLAASGWHTCSIAMRLFYDAILQYAAGEGSPGVDFTEWRKPVLAGDTLTSTITVLESRQMKSRPGLGVIRLRHELVNQRGELVLVMEHPFMARTREGVAA